MVHAGLLLLLVVLTAGEAQGRICRAEGRILDIRNSVDMLNKLSGCTVIDSALQIVLIDDRNGVPDFSNYTFPQLKEITDNLLIYNVKNLYSIGHLFPNLAVIRGQILFLNYALVIYGVSSLTEVTRVVQCCTKVIPDSNLFLEYGQVQVTARQLKFKMLLHREQNRVFAFSIFDYFPIGDCEIFILSACELHHTCVPHVYRTTEL